MLVRRSLLSYVLLGTTLLVLVSLLLWSSGTAHPQFLSWTGGAGWTGDVLDELDSHPPFAAEEGESTSAKLLAHKLDALQRRPALAHLDAVLQNEQACPRAVADAQVNPDQFKGSHEFWIGVGADEIRKRRKAIQAYVEDLQDEGVTVTGENLPSKRGIVMLAGNKDTAQSALAILRILRREHKSTLPVEVFSFPGEIRDKNIIIEMRDLGATHRELTNQVKNMAAWKNFQIKAASIIESSFTEVLYLDSDNFPLRDPEYLFDAESYKNNGRAVFWPDFNKDHPDNAIWRVVGKKCDYTEWEVESGQILIDKHGNDGLNLAALHVAAHMQAEESFYFQLSGGDKDTFRYAFWALDLPYLAAPRWLSSLGYHDGMDERFCGTTMLQYDIAPDEHGAYLPLFVHANLVKYRAVSKAQTLFALVKRASFDDAREPSLDRARMWTYQFGGLCVDMDVKVAEVQDHAGSGAEQRLVVENFRDVYGASFAGFEELFFKYRT